MDYNTRSRPRGFKKQHNFILNFSFCNSDCMRACACEDIIVSTGLKFSAVTNLIWELRSMDPLDTLRPRTNLHLSKYQNYWGVGVC